MPATIEILNEKRGNIFLSLDDIKNSELVKPNMGSLYSSKFTNPIDLICLNQVAQVEGLNIDVSTQEWDFLK